MTTPKLPKEFLERLKAITAKRPKTVIDHILKHGHITTEELKTRYGYNHPPRAARDVRDCGIPLKTVMVADTEGRKIAAYSFGDLSQVTAGGGRKAIGVKMKNALVALNGERCTICGKSMSSKQLQVDHRVPYVVAPDDHSKLADADDFMLVCGPCNRAKSWSCEHCENWSTTKIVETCLSCFWSNPDNYHHVAMVDSRRLDLTWQGEEVRDYDELKARADSRKQPLPEFVKEALKHVKDNNR